MRDCRRQWQFRVLSTWSRSIFIRSIYAQCFWYTIMFLSITFFLRRVWPIPRLLWSTGGLISSISSSVHHQYRGRTSFTSVPINVWGICSRGQVSFPFRRTYKLLSEATCTGHSWIFRKSASELVSPPPPVRKLFQRSIRDQQTARGLWPGLLQSCVRLFHVSFCSMHY